MKFYLKNIKVCFLLLSCILLSACPTPNQMHEAYTEALDDTVGKRLSDWDTFNYVHFHPDRVEKTIKLANGNTEHMFINKFAGKICYVFYEVEPQNSIIVGWRYEGDKYGCSRIY